MSFSDPGFEEMSLEELKTWLSQNDLSAADYDDLLNQLTVDLPTALPGVVQSSIGGDVSSTSIPQPSEGSTLVWDANQQLYVPSVAAPANAGQPWARVTGVANTFPVNAAYTPVNWTAGNVTSANGMICNGTNFTVPSSGEYFVHSSLTIVSFTPLVIGAIELSFQTSTDGGVTWANIAPGTDLATLLTGQQNDFVTAHCSDLVPLASGALLRTACTVVNAVFGSNLSANGGKSFIYRVSN